jgi:hypothetical protein
MTYADRIRNAASPQEGMLALAEGIDAVLAKLDREVNDTSGWGAWGAQTTAATPTPQPGAFVTEFEREMKATSKNLEREATRRNLAETTDPDERRALEAKLRLLEDEGQPVVAPVPEGRRVITTADDREITVDIPPASPERQESRRSWAVGVDLGGQIKPELPNDEAAEAFAKGGPMWLYLYDRDAVMGMPLQWRRDFVRDVEQDSPAQAQELGRDILKSEDPGALGDSAAYQGAV